MISIWQHDAPTTTTSQQRHWEQLLPPETAQTTATVRPVTLDFF